VLKPAAEEQPAAEVLNPADLTETVKPAAVIERAADAGSATSGSAPASPAGYQAPEGYPSRGPDGYQPPYPGPQASQWYSQLMRPEPRRRPRWPWAIGAVAAAGALIVAAVVLSLGSGHHAAAAGSSVGARPSPTTSGATSAPTLGSLELNQLRVGDCLTGANMKLDSNDPWPKLTLAVPCDQPHTAEVFFADNNFWPQNSSFPGNSAISKDGSAACNTAFRSYVGIAYSKSIYTWTNIIPDATTWPTGDRALHCVAYYSTSQQRAGAPLTHSIKSAGR